MAAAGARAELVLTPAAAGGTERGMAGVSATTSGMGTGWPAAAGAQARTRAAAAIAARLFIASSFHAPVLGFTAGGGGFVVVVQPGTQHGGGVGVALW